MLQIVPPFAHHLRAIAENIRPEDRAELTKSGDNRDTLEIIQGSVAASYESYVALWNGVPEAVFGIACAGSPDDAGSPWLLTTGTVGPWRRKFLSASHQYVDRWAEAHPVLFNAVDVDNEVSLRWLERLGFRAVDTFQSIADHPFFLMVRKPDV